jgi:membrane-anchored mycosin MYCP
MRYLGREYTGKGVTVAIVDSGVNAQDPRLAGVAIEGWSIELGATGHAILHPDYSDENGHGTEIAVAIHHLAPDARILAVKIMGQKLRTSAELMAAGIETAARHGAQIINLSLGTPNMGKALLLRDCCGNAVEAGSVVLAAAHPKGERAYPADLPETVGVAAHPDCPIDKTFWFDPKRFPRKKWSALSGKFLTHGYTFTTTSQKGQYRGSGIATAFLSGAAACFAEALTGHGSQAVIDVLRVKSLTPMPEIGYT